MAVSNTSLIRSWEKKEWGAKRRRKLLNYFATLTSKSWPTSPVVSFISGNCVVHNLNLRHKYLSRIQAACNDAVKFEFNGQSQLTAVLPVKFICCFRNRNNNKQKTSLEVYLRFANLATRLALSTRKHPNRAELRANKFVDVRALSKNNKPLPDNKHFALNPPRRPVYFYSFCVAFGVRLEKQESPQKLPIYVYLFVRFWWFGGWARSHASFDVPRVWRAEQALT